MSVRNLVEEFSALKDPRCGGKVEHRLIDILVIAVCAVIAGAESWEDFALYGRSKQDWLGTFLALPSGIPSHDTFRRVFMLIDTGRFEACFESWARSFGATLDREVVAIDGKTIRGSHDRGGCDNGFWPTCADEYWPTSGGWTGSAAPRGGTTCQRLFFSFLFMICWPSVAPWCDGSGRSPCRL
ncbi:ISAs1 family transposase [Acidiphilium sp. PA]|uniref:ISAs1 family transposase n=1 Tax=Acidiphilium sp. PA TaxID=2871705 RepID=UPI0022440D23|nr:ISAs1 family transposase [Acidiphilium sp. PA]MCW8309609.1 ISAs1 family transposase [Acidiphilium sp. PA]